MYRSRVTTSRDLRDKHVAPLHYYTS